MKKFLYKVECGSCGEEREKSELSATYDSLLWADELGCGLPSDSWCGCVDGPVVDVSTLTEVGCLRIKE